MVFLGHAHNDYLHQRPLLDAVELGFRSVEADVFLVDGKLLVGHSRAELKPERTLTRLYLEPINQMVSRGKVRSPFWLLVDIKADGTACYAQLKKDLTAYREILSHVKIVISGDRHRDHVRRQNDRRKGIRN